MKSRTLEEGILTALKFADVASAEGVVFANILGWITAEAKAGDACAMRIERAIVEKMPHLARKVEA